MIELLASADLEHQISGLALRTVGISAVALIVLTIAAVLNNKAPEKIRKYAKLPLFIGMAGIMAGSTLLLTGSTVYLNVKSESGGPVHWHSGIEFWACGSEVNLRDPDGLLSNKVGSPTYHEHNDKYIHLEGVVVNKSYDASLEKFMDVTGGYITPSSIGIPLSEDEAAWPTTGDQLDGDEDKRQLERVASADRIGQSADGNRPVLQLQNGDTCPDGTPGEIQVFVYRVNEEDETYTQEKLEDPGSYIMRDESTLGPPSDCVIVEFGPAKAATDKLCEQHGVEHIERCRDYGVSEFNPDLCKFREVNQSSEPEPQDPPANDQSQQPAEPTSQACLRDPESDEPCEDTPRNGEATPSDTGIPEEGAML
ncbi:MAG: hypothetical protein U5L95_04680 [Candidatus Saccharibacteria bacterium]|nr:hypothetical protein [Candidatus Saccharibacteria bacterium]